MQTGSANSMPLGSGSSNAPPSSGKSSMMSKGAGTAVPKSTATVAKSAGTAASTATKSAPPKMPPKSAPQSSMAYAKPTAPTTELVAKPKLQVKGSMTLTKLKGATGEGKGGSDAMAMPGKGSLTPVVPRPKPRTGPSPCRCGTESEEEYWRSLQTKETFCVSCWDKHRVQMPGAVGLVLGLQAMRDLGVVGIPIEV